MSHREMRSGWGNSLYTNSLTRRGTPTPTLPRKRERGKSSGCRFDSIYFTHALDSQIGFPDRVVGQHLAGTAGGADRAGFEQIGAIDHLQHLLHVLLDDQHGEA